MTRKVIFIVFLFFDIIVGQEILPNLYKSKLRKFEYESGKNWDINSTLNPFRYSLSDNDSIDFYLIESYIGSKIIDEELYLYNYHRIKHKKNFYIYLNGYLYKSESNNTQIKNNKWIYDVYFSGLGYENNWLFLQLGEGTQSWGANHDIELSLSENSEPYNYATLGLNFGILRVKYFHGFLESDQNKINRYITGRGLELTNKKSLIIGISEIVVYSGINRNFDFSYFNPMSTHLEIELNDRTNRIGSGNGNGIWQASIDLFFASRFRFSGNFLIDEFVLDRQQVNDGKASGKAYSYKVVYNPKFIKHDILSFFYSKVSIGTYTFRHQSGYNNFVQSSKPLGNILGSDCIENKFAINISAYDNLYLEFSIGLIKVGQNNIWNNPYDPYWNYTKTTFPSGSIKYLTITSQKIQYLHQNNFLFSCEINFGNTNLESIYNDEKMKFSFKSEINMLFQKSK